MGGGMVRLIWPKIYNSNYWVANQQTSWVNAPWWFNVSPWQICITFVWPRGSVKLTVPSSWSERHLHFASIILCLALLFIISMYGNAQRFILRFPFRCKQRQNKQTFAYMMWTLPNNCTSAVQLCCLSKSLLGLHYKQWRFFQLIWYNS